MIDQNLEERSFFNGGKPIFAKIGYRRMETECMASDHE